MDMRFSKFPVPVLGDDIQNIYFKLYGDTAKNFLEILTTSPDEIAVISRLLIYLKQELEQGDN